jgi:sigma-B regulation protein RsbU (phosphoserine phosphatase)
MFTPRANSYFDDRSSAFRLVFSALAGVLLILACVKFYQYASSPTDENLFTHAPTNVIFKNDVNASPVFKNKPLKIDNGGIREGDLFIQVGEQRIRTQSELDKALENYAPEDSLSVTVLRNPGNIGRSFRATKFALERSVEQLPVSAYVVDITENGASDRAGMKIGDLIVKINGKGFKSIFDADNIMRSAQADRAVEYEIIRSGKTIILPVKLARFGIKFFQFAFFLCGISFIVTGYFLGMKQPKEKAIRLLSVGFLMMGYGFAAMGNRSTVPKSIPEMLFLMSPVIVLLFGIAIWMHSTAYFPKKREILLNKRWIVVAPYLIAVATVVLSLFTVEDGFFINGVIAMVIFNTIIYFKYRKTGDDETKKINLIINRIAGFSLIGSVLLNVILNNSSLGSSLGFLIPLAILGIPLGYLYVIGRYRLFDIDIRLKRNIQYTFFSLVWPALLVFLAVRSITGIVYSNLDIPNVRLTGASLEVLDTPLSPGEQTTAEKVISSSAAILIVLGFIWVGKKGQKFINNRYYRNEYDYKEAAQQISEVLASKVELSVLARGVIEKIASIMHLKQAGILIFRDEEYFVCGESFGIPQKTWSEICSRIDTATVQSISRFKIDSRFSVENLPEYAREALIALKFRHIAALHAKGKLTGLLLLGEKLSDTPFHAEDFAFLTSVSNQISIAIENAFLYEDLAEQERLKHELEIARRIQLESLPQKTPNISGLDISGLSKPALEVGGDYFDYLVNSPECITIVIGDVSGKGTSAALYMSKVQGMIRSLHEITASSPRDLLNHANKLLHLDIDRRSYITALGARFDSSEKSVTISRAGHLPLFHYSAEANCFKKILPKGIGLALSSNKLFSKALEEVQCPFKNGDIFLMLTDGITEAQNLLKEEFGTERLEAIIAENKFLKAEEIRDKVIAEMEAFSGEAEQHDDCTVIVVKVV